MLYSSGMPVLYIIGIVHFVVMYWVDKFCCKHHQLNLLLVIRWYKAPPMYGMELATLSRRMMKFAVLFHMAFGFYMFSESSIFTTEESETGGSLIIRA
jgi:hypothetical protein